jgi:hypothetical protein
MARKFVFSFVVVACSIGVLAAEDFTGRITKVSGGKITFQETKFSKDDDGKFKVDNVGSPKDLTVADNVKVTKGGGFGGKGGKGGKGKATEVEDGMKNAMFTTLPEKGLNARITVEGDKVTAINVLGGGKGKKKKDAND